MVKRSNGPVMAPRRCGARTNPANARHALVTTLLGAVLAASCTGVEDPPTPELRGGTLGDEELEAIAREALAAREGVEPDALELVTHDAVHLRHSGVAASAFKFIDGPSRRWLSVTLVDGAPVEAESLIQAEEAARAALHGRLDPALHELLVTAPPAGPISVAIWLRHTDDGRCDDLREPPMTRVRPGPLAGPMRAGIRPADNDGGELDVDPDGEPIPPEVDPDDPGGGGDATDEPDEPDDDTPDEPIGPQPAEQPAGVDRAEVRAFSAALRDCRRSQMLATIAPFARRLETELGTGDAGPIVAQIVDDDGTIRTPDGLPKGARVAQLYGVAPAIRVSLRPEEILESDQWGEVDTVYPVTAAQNELGITRVAIGANHLNDWGVDGAGQRIGVTEVGGEVTFDFDDNPAVDMGLITTDTLNACQNQHGDTVVGVLHSQDTLQRGIASAAEIRVGGSCSGDDGELVAASERAVAWGATVLNLSWGVPVAVGSAPGFVDRTYDQMVYDDAVTVVKSAGNRGTADGMVTSPGLGYGVLTVGNHDDSNSTRWGDDVIAPMSSFRDPGSLHGDRNKPEIAAPGESVNSTQHAIFFATSGTSLAAPHVSGAAALLQQRDAMFELFPEGMKAVLMASAVHNIEGATRISDRDGAGGLVVDNADNIFRGVTGDWDGRLETCNEGNAHVVTTMPLRAGLLTRAVLVWGTEGAYGRYELEPSADLDLDVWAPGGVRVASGLSRAREPNAVHASDESREEMRIPELGPLHPETAETELDLGELLAEVGDLEGAVLHLRAGAAALAYRLPPEHPQRLAVDRALEESADAGSRATMRAAHAVGTGRTHAATSARGPGPGTRMTLLNTTLVGVLSLLAPPSAGRGGSGPDRVVSVTLISVDGSAVESPLPSAACAGGQVLHVHRLTAMPVAQGTPGDALAQLGRWSATVWVGQREGLSVASNEVTVFGDGATVTSVELPGGKPLVQPSFAAARLIGASKSARVGFTVHVAGRCGPAA